MAFVITSPCQNEKAAECVDVCPVDCIEDGGDQFYIDPEVCINCGACVSVCPVSAIVEDLEMMPGDEVYLEKAEAYFNNKS
ncbi:indolepyruvate ferredoxin oxidoreductase subunit alpha [Alkalibacillus salilacus]|uniref:Ferredoxin n=1 Tax=Alkalibacillus salilacus TaxID=284582 RepID=A0ABT9VF03_9BACI|nr:4Fe-4S binding protein [Alkalibacillus salilacus]MDQ0159440.1 NAD-dependent dihydropyrimidine dehydrogenase PreA subunit [Alkalibacillus salilacus]